MKVILVSLAVLGLMGLPVMGRYVEHCEMARELLNHGFPREQLADWVCLIQHESYFNTAAVNYYNDGSRNYGLFQINNRNWCVEGYPGGECNVNCYDLTSDDITASCNCAHVIYNQQGFGAWMAWDNYCSGGRAPTVDYCFY